MDPRSHTNEVEGMKTSHGQLAQEINKINDKKNSQPAASADQNVFSNVAKDEDTT